MKQKFVPEYEGELRKHALQIPRCISECSGIRVFGRRIKSLVFSTDVAIIKNINADAVIAVYNFTPQPSITQAIISASDVPVFAGVGGGYTNGQRSVNMAAAAEQLGAFGVVCNLALGWRVWDYSLLWGNLWGQICPLYSSLWFLLCIPVFGSLSLCRARLDAPAAPGGGQEG